MSGATKEQTLPQEDDEAEADQQQAHQLLPPIPSTPPVAVPSQWNNKEQSPLLLITLDSDDVDNNNSNTAASPLPDLLQALHQRQDDDDDDKEEEESSYTHDVSVTSEDYHSPLEGAEDDDGDLLLMDSRTSTGHQDLLRLPVDSADHPLTLAEAMAPEAALPTTTTTTASPQRSSQHSLLHTLSSHSSGSSGAMMVDTPGGSTHSRRRAHGSTNRRVSATVASTASPSTASSLNPTTYRTSRPSHAQREQHRSSSHSLPEESAPTSGLRSSLDSGMAAIRRWIRSRPEPVPRQQESDDIYALNPRSPYHPTILEEEEVSEQEEEEFGRQRAFSEPNVSSQSSSRHVRRRRGRGRGPRGRTRTESAGDAHLSSSAAAALYASPTSNSSNSRQTLPPAARLQSVSNSSLRSTTSTSSLGGGGGAAVGDNSRTEAYGHHANTTSSSSSVRILNEPTAARPSTESSATAASIDPDPERSARVRWIRINRRFQFVITIVALLFSLLLFSILICWVVLTSAYVVSFNKSCDVPLKPYFWLVTFQLVLDVFRSDIMRFVFRWDPSSNQRIPCRIIVYNVAYLLYALLVLRLGILSVFVEDDVTCSRTAPELFNTSTAFVSLSIAAWTTIICGYLLPFCIVAALLTYNGYSPWADLQPDEPGTTQAVFPAAYSTSGAPPGCVERLREVRADDFLPDSTRECCICMEEFSPRDVVVETSCKHRFHKQCCREWLRQARTCPVCRTDIPSTLEDVHEETESPTSAERIPLGPTGRPVVGLFRWLRSASDLGGNETIVGGRRERSPSSVTNVSQNLP